MRVCSIERDMLIDIRSTFSDFSRTFHEIIDFVYIDEYLKQFLYEQYKIYRNIGFDLTIIVLILTK
ncbi:MAG: hypothetical protein ACTS8X_00730 [Arsenophonus sp. ER-NS5-MAG3]